MTDPKLIPVLERCIKAAKKHRSLKNRKRYIERFMQIAWPGGFFGWESCDIGVLDGPSISYLDPGDTYETTICMCPAGWLFISSWGDWYERMEQRHCEETRTIRCGNCGQFTPVAEEWNKTRCESCGCNVSTGDRMEEESEGSDDDTE